jgi:hypothetical protein
VHSRRPLRAGRSKDETPDERRAHQGDVLADEAADREPQQVDPGEAEGVDNMIVLRQRRPDRREGVQALWPWTGEQDGPLG